MGEQIEQLPLARLRESADALRYSQRGTLRYKQLKDDIRKNGVIVPIIVRPLGDGYEIIKGTQRYCCAHDLRHETIPSIIRNLSNEQVIQYQLSLIEHRIDYTPEEQARQYRRLIALKPDGETLRAFCGQFNLREEKVKQVLSLLRLSDQALTFVNRGQISIGNAYRLARIPLGFQEEFIDAARTLSRKDFDALVLPQIKQWRENVKCGFIHQDMRVEPVAVVRNLKKILQVLDNPIVSSKIVLSALGDDEFNKYRLEGFQLGLNYAVQLDPEAKHKQILQIKNRLEALENKEVARKARLKKRADRLTGES